MTQRDNSSSLVKGNTEDAAKACVYTSLHLLNAFDAPMIRVKGEAETRNKFHYQKYVNGILLLACCVALSLIWLIILPTCAERPAMREHLQWLDDEGIDPSAMYYTELPVMEKILARQQQRRLRDKIRSHP